MSAGPAILAFGAKVGIDREQIVSSESVRALHLSADRPAGVFGALEPADFERLLAELDGALSLQIGLPNLPPLLVIEAGQVRLPAPEGLRAIRGLDQDLLLRLTLDVAKGPLLAHWQLTGSDYFVLPFLYVDSFLRLLRADLLTLDKHLFAAPDRATLVAVEDGRFHLGGPLLQVCGLPVAQQLVAESTPITARLRQRLQAYRLTARDSLSWAGFQLDRVTPAHFLADEADFRGIDPWLEGEGNPLLRVQKAALSGLLAGHALTANVLFTANRSALEEDGFSAVYASADNTAVLRLPAANGGQPEMATLTRWAVWPFSSQDGVRLTVLQNVVARELSSEDSEENYVAFKAQMDHLLNEARWHHRVLVDRQIDRHFSELQNLSDYVSGVTADVGAAIDSLTKGFVEALLGAVGVIVLTLLAALVEANRPGQVFRVGMWAYALYLVFFQGLYRMGSQWQSYRLLLEESAARMDLYRDRLGSKRLKTAEDLLRARQAQFRFWFWLTAVLYLLVAAFLIFLAEWLPGWLQSLPAIP